MTGDSEENLAGGVRELLFMAWGLAPALMVALYVGFAIKFELYRWSSGVPLVLILSMLSQYMWSRTMLRSKEVTSGDQELNAFLLTIGGLFVNAAIVFGGCSCMVSGSF